MLTSINNVSTTLMSSLDLEYWLDNGIGKEDAQMVRKKGDQDFPKMDLFWKAKSIIH
jgi:hypothetical protein